MRLLLIPSFLFVTAAAAAQSVSAASPAQSVTPVPTPAQAVAPSHNLSYAPSPAFASSHDERRWQNDPADSTYRAARTLLNRGEWRRAATLFASIGTRFPTSEYRADALYWQAFALYRIGGTAELREALTVLSDRKTRFRDERNATDVAALENRVRGALSARGDTQAAAELNRTASRESLACDEEEQSVRASALRALVRSEVEGAMAQVDRVLARRDECSLPLRQNALMLLGEMSGEAPRERVTAIALNDPNEDMRVDAIGYLGRYSNESVVTTLEQILRDDSQERLQRAAVRALGQRGDARSKAAVRATVERRDATERLRLDALGTFDRGEVPEQEWRLDCGSRECVPDFSSTPRPPRPASPAAPVAAPTAPTPATPPAAPLPAGRPGVAPLPSTPGAMAPDISYAKHGERGTLSAEDAAWLRGVYPRLETTRLRARAASILVRSTDEATVTWLVTLVQRDDEAADVRAAVLARLGRSMPVAQLGRLYDAASDRAVRSQIISTLGDRSEPEATDKLIAIVRTGTDPQLRRSAVSALTRKNDPRATQLLLELVDR